METKRPEAPLRKLWVARARLDVVFEEQREST